MPEALCFWVVRPSTRPSVRSPKYPLSACAWVRWLIRPIVTVLRPVRPSVRPDRFPGISRWTHAGSGMEFCMLMYPGHFQNWLDCSHGRLIFLLLVSLLLSETGQICGFWAFPGERMEGMAWNCACWCILTTYRTVYIIVMVCLFF